MSLSYYVFVSVLRPCQLQGHGELISYLISVHSSWKNPRQFTYTLCTSSPEDPNGSQQVTTDDSMEKCQKLSHASLKLCTASYPRTSTVLCAGLKLPYLIIIYLLFMKNKGCFLYCITN